MNYIEVVVQFSELNPWRDILISTLADMGFESFVETKSGVKSYIPEKDFAQIDMTQITAAQGVFSVEHHLIEDQNWNARWEEHFDPVLVEDKLAIRAPFHKEKFNVQLELIIQPQMSFGTGHHQTTWLMAKRLFELDLYNKQVLDMGTGTGVLAILAEKKGARAVFAPDIDEWSYKNAQENVELNQCNKIEIALGDHQTIHGRRFDVIAANINKNVLIEQFSVYSQCLNPSGKLLISGFFKTDQNDLKKAAEKHGFIFEQTLSKDEWAALEFTI